MSHLGKPIPEDFEYASNTNDRWLSRQELQDLINEIERS
jgi:hypothetical protein